MRSRIFAFVVCLLATCSLSAQFNLKVGLEYDRSQDAIIQKMFDQFNEENDQYDKELSQIKGRIGVVLGVRYQWESLFLEAHYSSLSGRSEATGVVGNTTIRKELISSSRIYGLGIENRFGMIGIGGTVGYNRLKLRTNIGDSGEDKELSKERVPFARLHLSIHFPSDKISLVIRPHYQFALGSYDMNALSQELLAIPNDSAYEPKSWGISFILYNGRQ